MQKIMLESFMSDSFRNGYHYKPKRMYFIVVVLKYCFESRFSTCNKKYICKNAIDIIMKKINSTKKESRCSRRVSSSCFF
jgi:hypothetical protein